MPFSDLERYLFPVNACTFGLCQVGSYDHNETDEEEVDEVAPGAVGAAFHHEDPPSPVAAEPKRVRFDESEPVIEYYNYPVGIRKKRNLKRRILQKSAEQRQGGQSNHNRGNGYKETHNHHHHSDGSVSPVRRHISSASSSSPLSRRSGRRRRKGNMVSTIFLP